MADDRDPRVDPQPGDVVQVRNDKRRVIALFPTAPSGTVVSWRSPWNNATCLVRTWRRWAKCGEVVSRG